MRRVLESKRGIAVTMAMWFLAVLAIIGTSFAYMMRLEPMIARHHQEGVKAMYVAMAGVDKAYTLLGTDSPIREFAEPLKDDTGTTVGTYMVKMYPLYLFALQGGNSKQFFRYNTYKNEWEKRRMQSTPREIGPGGALAGDETDFFYTLRGGKTKDFYRYEISRDWWERKKIASTPRAIGWGGALVHWYEVNYYECPECGFPPKYDEPGNCPVCGEELDPNISHYFYATRGDATTEFYYYSVDKEKWTTMATTPDKVDKGGALAWADGDYLCPVCNHASSTSGTCPNCNRELEKFIYALQGGGTTGFWRYSLNNNQWQKYRCPECGHISPTLDNCPTHDTPLEMFIPDTPASVGEGGALTWAGGNYIYALRGNSNVFWRYKISTNAWEGMASILGEIGVGGALAWDGGEYIYCLRGANTSDFYRYEISKNEWATLPRVSYKIGWETHYASIGSGGSLAAGDLYRIVSTGYIPDKDNVRATKKIEAIIDIRPKARYMRRIIYWREIPKD